MTDALVQCHPLPVPSTAKLLGLPVSTDRGRIWGALSLLCKEAYPVELIVTLTTSELLGEGPENILHGRTKRRKRKDK